MSNDMERLSEIEARKAEIEESNNALINEVKETAELTEERSAEIETETRNLASEIQNLEAEKSEIQERMKEIESVPVVEERKMNDVELRAKQLMDTGRLEMRSILSSGHIAQPVQVGGINDMPEVPGGIVDDVKAVALTGNGTYRVAYKASRAVAAAVTEGNAIGGTDPTFNYVDITPAEWGILTQVSNQIKKYSPLNYLSAVEYEALVALRTYAEGQIYTNVAASSLADATTFATTPLDEEYLRTLLVNFVAIPGKGDVCLYINRTDLGTLGKVRGTNEKLPLYNIKFDAGTTMSGVISEGGMACKFRVTNQLATKTQLFGQPGTIEMPMWDGYQIETNEGGVYFSTNMIAVRGLQTANADLCAYHGMAVVTQA